MPRVIPVVEEGHYHAEEATPLDSKATSITRHQGKSYCRERTSEKGLALTWLRDWWLPPHLMHPTKPLGCIYVEKTPEQCYLSCRTHKGFEKVFDGTSTQMVDWMINKWRVKIAWRELYNVRDPPRRGGTENQ